MFQYERNFRHRRGSSATFQRIRPATKVGLTATILLLLLSVVAIPTEAGTEQRRAVTGPQRTIVILIEFPDVKHSTPPEIIHARLFTELDQWIREVSYGKAWLEGNTTEWITLPKPFSHYFPNYPYRISLGGVVDDGLIAADPFVNYADYKYVLLIHSSDYGTIANSRERRRWSILDGILEWSYVVASEYVSVSVIAHEISHILYPSNYERTPPPNIQNYHGLPDLYYWDFRNPQHREYCVGIWI